MNLLKFQGLSFILLSMTFSSHAEEIEEYAMINITAGQVGIADKLSGPQRYGLDYRFRSVASRLDFRLIPALGAAVAKNAAYFI